MITRTLLAAMFCVTALALPACSGIDLGDNPGRDVSKQTGPLVLPPPDMKDGSKE